ncbi:MAG: hypothetical protein IJM83_03095 [Firmicutes bacterium]|nr:hypothetical protein [Bacillota bacterium]
MIRKECRRILLLVLALVLILSGLTGCEKDVSVTDRDKVQHARQRDDDEDEDEEEYAKPAQAAEATAEAKPAEDEESEATAAEESAAEESASEGSQGDFFEEESSEEEEPAHADTPSFTGSRGNGTPYVEYHGKVYFWGFSSDTFWETGTWGNYYPNGGVVVPLMAVDPDDPNAEPEIVLTSDGIGNIGIWNDCLYYESKDQNNKDCVKSLGLDGTVGTVYSDLYGIVGADDMSGVLICSGSYSGGVSLLDMASGTESVLAVDGSFILAENGIIYYYTTPSRSMLSISAYDVAGKINYSLGTVTQTLWSESEISTMGGTSIESAQITDGYLYICYGSRAGTGMIFQGGEIARIAVSDLMNCPGPEHVYGSQGADSEDNIYVVSANGVHTVFFERYNSDYKLEQVCITVPGGEPTQISFEDVHAKGEIYTSNWTNVCIRPDDSGTVITLITPADLTSLITAEKIDSQLTDGSIVQIKRTHILGDWVYFTVEKGIYSDSMGWRDEYAREWGVIMRKNLQTGVIQQLHSY